MIKLVTPVVGIFSADAVEPANRFPLSFILGDWCYSEVYLKVPRKARFPSCVARNEADTWRRMVDNCLVLYP